MQLFKHTLQRFKSNPATFSLIKAIKGFTLIEVMIALLVISVVMVAVLQALQIQTKLQSAVNNRQAAHLLSWNHAVRLWSNPPKKLSDVDKTEIFKGQKWVVERKVQPTLTPLIDQVKIRAFPEGSFQKGSYELTIYLDRTPPKPDPYGETD